MRRVAALLLAIATVGASIAVVASGSDVATLKTTRSHAARSPRAGGLPLLKSLTPVPRPRNCSVAAGPCIEGCALPVAAGPALASPEPGSGLCRSTAEKPCMELIARDARAPRATFPSARTTVIAPFCTPQRPGAPFKNLPPRLRRHR